MKKGLIILLVVGLVCCIATIVGGVIFYQNVILPNTDSESTVTINGQTVTQIRRTPTTFNNMVIESQIKFINKLNELGQTGDGSTLEGVKALVKEINTIIDQNVLALDSYKTTLVQYNDYKDFIDTTRSYYVQYKEAINTAYSDSNLQKLFASEISEADYNKIVADSDALDATSKKLDAEFGKALEAFATKFGVKLVNK